MHGLVTVLEGMRQFICDKYHKLFMHTKVLEVTNWQAVACSAKMCPVSFSKLQCQKRPNQDQVIDIFALCFKTFLVFLYYRASNHSNVYIGIKIKMDPVE